MKVIGLMLTRNEEHMLPHTLPPLEAICDHIIIADQHSEDGTRAIIKQSKKTTLIDNPPTSGSSDYDSQGRPLLLNAARDFDGNNLLLALDADEVIPPAMGNQLKETAANRYTPGCGFEMRWTQLWKNPQQYLAITRDRFHVPWMRCAFYDDRRPLQKINEFAHGGRFPVGKIRYHYLKDCVLLHFHWIFFEKALWQQVWYMMKQWEYHHYDAAFIPQINKFYASESNYSFSASQLQQTPAAWLADISVPPAYPADAHDWRKAEVMAMVKQHGIAHFEPLNIWFLEPLRALFCQECERSPISIPVPFSLSQWWRVYRLCIRDAYRQITAPNLIAP